MKIKADKIKVLIAEINAIIQNMKSAQITNEAKIEAVCQTYQKSARNLTHYKVLRNFDLRSIQKRLRNLGMSRFANAEGHVMASLLNTRFILNTLIENKPAKTVKSGLSIKNGKRLLVNHTKELLGYRSKGRRVRIMVTQPSESAHNYELVHRMVKNGMNCARVNCAHDDPEVWKKIINNIKKASSALGKRVKISMDLAGPKIRTGEIKPGPKVKKFNPERDEMGNILNPSTICFVTELTEESEPNCIPVDGAWLSNLKLGEKLECTDTRGKHRTLKVVAKEDQTVFANCYETTYIATGTALNVVNSPERVTNVGELPPVERYLLLRTGDVVNIVKDDVLGEPAMLDEDGIVVERAFISCQLKEVFDNVQRGEKILFDDGKIEGEITESYPDHFEVLITRAKENGSKLKAEKGINFPTTDMGISGLTAKDKEDLAFVAENADVVNFSFVNSAEDVKELLDELERLNARDKLSVILKIETRRAFDNLEEILLEAMKIHYVGVMIARGDLAVETGWDNIGRIQKEILSLCNAAHIPVVWATQVLESMAKKGLPSRSEITDATSALKAECVMLNKGLYINDAIKLLDTILKDMEHYHDKNESMLPQLEKLLN